MPEPTRINLTYNGPEVHDGTMPIGLVADALDGSSSETTTTKPDELVGSLVSNNKEKKRGTFRMEGGRTVPYHYVGTDVDDFLRGFSYRGAVRVNGEVKTDEPGKPIHLSIQSVTRLQKGLFGDGEGS